MPILDSPVEVTITPPNPDGEVGIAISHKRLRTISPLPQLSPNEETRLAVMGEMLALIPFPEVPKVVADSENQPQVALFDAHTAYTGFQTAYTRLKRTFPALQKPIHDPDRIQAERAISQKFSIPYKIAMQFQHTYMASLFDQHGALHVDNWREGIRKAAAQNAAAVAPPATQVGRLTVKKRPRSNEK